MISNLFYSCIFFILSAGGVSAQVIDWQNTIGGNQEDNIKELIRTNDGGYILGGESDSDNSPDKSENSMGSMDYWIVKIDSLGSIVWENTIGGSGGDILTSIDQTDDGGAICGGYSYSSISGDKTIATRGYADYWIVKLNSSGSIQWQKAFGGNLMDYLYTITQTADGGYIVGGTSYSGISGDKTDSLRGNGDWWILKLDSFGDIQWQKSFGGSNLETMTAINQTADGGYICGGFTNSGVSSDITMPIYGGDDFLIVRLDSSGNTLWQNVYGGNDIDQLMAFELSSDNGYLCGGFSRSNISGIKSEDRVGLDDYWVLKLDEYGNILWQNTIGGSLIDRLISMKETNSGDVICGGFSYSNISGDKTENSRGGADFWIIKLDSSGSIIWQKTIGGSSTDLLYSIIETADVGSIFGGISASNISGEKTENVIGFYDFWVVKLLPDNITGFNNTTQDYIELLLSPNPATESLKITLNDLNDVIHQVQIFDMTGRLTHEQRGLLKSGYLDISYLDKNIYIIELTGEKSRYRSAFIKQ